MNGDSVVHLEIISGDLKGKHFYFGGLSAIYEKFDKKFLRVSESRLYGFVIEPEKPYQNKVCIIRRDKLHRKKTIRRAPIKILRVE